MEQDQRLTPLPRVADIQTNPGEYPAAYAGFYDDETLASKRSLRQYFNVVYKRLPIIAAIALIVTAAASFYSYRLPSEYQAKTELIIEPRSKPVTQKEAININFGNDQNYYNTQLQLLQSMDLLKKVVVSLNLHHEPNLYGEDNRGIFSSIRNFFSGSPKTAAPENTLPVVNETSVVNDKDQRIQLSPEEDARAVKYAARLAGGLQVFRVEDTNLVQITVKNQIPALTAKFADKIAEIFMEENANRELEGAKTAYAELTDSIEKLKLTIAQQQSEQMQEQQSSGLPLQDKGGDLRASNLVTLQNQYNTAHDETGKIQAQYNAAVSAAESGDVLSIAPNPSIQEARTNLLRRQAELEKRIEDIDRRKKEAEEKRENLRATYTDEYKDVKAVTAQINELESQKTRLTKEVSEKIKFEDEKLEKNARKEVLTSLRSQLGAAQQREERARVAYAQAAAQANVEGQAETRLTTLKREIETNRNLLDTYTQRQKEQELAISGGRPNNIKISSHATVPGGPIGPQRLRNIIIALLLSLAFGVGLAFLMDYLDDSVRTSEDVSRHLGLPTLALIPHHSFTDKKGLSLIPKNGNGNGNGNLSPSALIAFEERNSPMAEAYRHLRTSLLFSSAGKPPQTILVTSSQPSEGKTTTAINMAITLAQGDADVIIIDCDLRRPRLHNHFGLSNTHGLTNYLSGEKSTDNLIKTSPLLPRLKIITSGPIPPNPAELLSSNEMKNMLQFLRGRFKHVIIDSPPALSFTDAAILSTVVDGVVLVAMTGKSSIHLMRQFKLRLSAIGARIYGVVLNGVKAGSMDYDYYGTGYYDYYHSGDSDDSTPKMEEVVKAVHETKG